MISVEFMLIFAISLAMIAMLAAEMFAYGSEVRSRIEKVGLAASAESSARFAESAYRSGIMHGRKFRIEETLLIDSEDQIIEAGGVFEHDEAEPI